jgi:hypothetical protein
MSSLNDVPVEKSQQGNAPPPDAASSPNVKVGLPSQPPAVFILPILPWEAKRKARKAKMSPEELRQKRDNKNAAERKRRREMKEKNPAGYDEKKRKRNVADGKRRDVINKLHRVRHHLRKLTLTPEQRQRRRERGRIAQEKYTKKKKQREIAEHNLRVFRETVGAIESLSQQERDAADTALVEQQQPLIDDLLACENSLIEGIADLDWMERFEAAPVESLSEQELDFAEKALEKEQQAYNEDLVSGEKSVKEELNAMDWTDPAELAAVGMDSNFGDPIERAVVDTSSGDRTGREKAAHVPSSIGWTEPEMEPPLCDRSPPFAGDCAPDSSTPAPGTSAPAHCNVMTGKDHGTDPGIQSERPPAEDIKPAALLPAQQPEPDPALSQEKMGNAQCDCIDLTDGAGPARVTQIPQQPDPKQAICQEKTSNAQCDCIDLTDEAGPALVTKIPVTSMKAKVDPCGAPPACPRIIFDVNPLIADFQKQRRESATQFAASIIQKAICKNQKEQLRKIAIPQGILKHEDDVVASVQGRRGKEEITRWQLGTLLPGIWLDDNPINAVLGLIAGMDERLSAADVKRKRSHIFTTMFYSKLVFSDHNARPVYRYDLVKSWAGHVKGNCQHSRDNTVVNTTIVV